MSDEKINWTYTETRHMGTFSAKAIEILSTPISVLMLQHMEEQKEMKEMSKIPKRKMPKKGTLIKIKYGEKEKEAAMRAKEFCDRYGLVAELIELN